MKRYAVVRVRRDGTQRPAGYKDVLAGAVGVAEALVSLGGGEYLVVDTQADCKVCYDTTTKEHA